MTLRDRERCMNYAARLAVIVQGCTSATCPFRRRGQKLIGTANICRCGDEARNLVNAISERLPNAEVQPRREAT